MELGLICELRGSEVPVTPPLNYPFAGVIYYSRKGPAEAPPGVLTDVTETNILEKLRAASSLAYWIFLQEGVSCTETLCLPPTLTEPAYRAKVYRDGYLFRETVIVNVRCCVSCICLDYNLWTVEPGPILEITLTYPGYTDYANALPRLQGRTDLLSYGFSTFFLNAIGAHETLQRRAIPIFDTSEGSYITMFFLADSFEKTGQPEKASWWYHRAHEVRPTRLEPLFSLSRLYRQQSLIRCARQVLAWTQTTQLPHTETMFLNEGLYKGLFAAESARLDATPEKLRALDLQLRVEPLDKNLRQAYTAVLAGTSFQLPGENVITLPAQLSPNEYRPLNPSLLANAEGYLVNVRHTNYYLYEGKYSHFVMLDGSGIFKTRNFLYQYDHHWKLQWVRELEDDFRLYEGKNVWGVEDLRIFQGRGRVWALADSKFTTPANQVYLVSYDPETFRLALPSAMNSWSCGQPMIW